MFVLLLKHLGWSWLQDITLNVYRVIRKKHILINIFYIFSITVGRNVGGVYR